MRPTTRSCLAAFTLSLLACGTTPAAGPPAPADPPWDPGPRWGEGWIAGACDDGRWNPPQWSDPGQGRGPTGPGIQQLALMLDFDTEWAGFDDSLPTGFRFDPIEPPRWR